MTVSRILSTGFASFALAGTAFAAPAKVTYEDDVLPIFRNNCLKCHNPDKMKGDLDLSTFSGTIKGGGSGPSANAGDPAGSKLYKSITHAEEPEMPPKSDKLPEKEIATVRKWIEGGLLESSGSKAIAANKPKVDLTLNVAAVGKPTGPPPMPGSLSLEPVVKPLRPTALTALANSPWAPVVALGGPKQIILYNTADLEFLGVLPFAEGFPHDLKFSRNGKLLLAGGGRGGQSGFVVVWDITKGERVITVGDQYDSVLAADISSDQKWIALGGPDRLVKIYDTKDGSLEHKIKKHTEWVTALEFSPDSKFLVTGDRNGGLMLWETASGQEMFALNGHKGVITAVSWRGDSELVVSASEDGTIKLWKASDGQQLKSWNAHNGGALSARFTHDGRIVSCGRDNKVQLWDVTGNNLKTLPFTGDLPTRVTFSDDGKKVIGSDFNGSVYVWDAAAGKQIGELQSNPPTLAERVQRGANRLTELQTAVDKASANHATLEAEAKVAQAQLDKAKSALQQAQAAIPAKEKEAVKLKEESAKNASDETIKKQVADIREQIKKLQAQVASLNKEIPTATKQAEAAAKKASDAKASVEQAMSSLAAAKTSLAKWKAAQQSVQAKPASGKVAAR